MSRVISPNGRYVDGGGDAHQRALFSIGEAMGITSFTGFGASGGAPGARTALDSLRASAHLGRAHSWKYKHNR